VVTNLLLWSEVAAANAFFVLHKSIELQRTLFVIEAGFDANVPVLLQ
jgi:hypothetical protein